MKYERRNPKHETWNRPRDSGDLKLPRMFQHSADVAARQGQIMERKRASGWTEKVSPPGRVYQVISDAPKVPSSVGYNHREIGPSLSAIAWNPMTGRYEPAYGRTHDDSVEKQARIVKNSRKAIVGI